MKPRKFTYYLFKFTLLDELLGILYWAAAIYGIFLIVEHSRNDTLRLAALAIYIVVVAVIYFVLLKKAKTFFAKGLE